MKESKTASEAGKGPKYVAFGPHPTYLSPCRGPEAVFDSLTPKSKFVGNQKVFTTRPIFVSGSNSQKQPQIRQIAPDCLILAIAFWSHFRVAVTVPRSF